MRKQIQILENNAIHEIVQILRASKHKEITKSKEEHQCQLSNASLKILLNCGSVTYFGFGGFS